MTLNQRENLGQTYTDQPDDNSELMQMVMGWGDENAPVEHDESYNQHLGDLLSDRVKEANLQGDGETPLFRWLLEHPLILIALITVSGVTAVGLQQLLNQPHV